MNATLYFLHNESSATELSSVALELMRDDIESAYDTEFAPRHAVLPITIQLDKPGVVIGGRVMHLVDEIPEAPGALAYHTRDAQGRPVLRLGVNVIRSQGGILLDEISKAISHEIFETAINPFVNDYSFVEGKTAMLAKEACDPVQASWWRHNATAISAFVTPAYFDPDDMDGPYSFPDNLLTGPQTCAPGGYQAWSDGSQTFGEHVSEWKKTQVVQYGRHATKEA